MASSTQVAGRFVLNSDVSPDSWMNTWLSGSCSAAMIILHRWEQGLSVMPLPDTFLACVVLNTSRSIP